MELVIGNKNWSTWSLRPWLVLSEFGFAFSVTQVPLRTAETTNAISVYSPSRLVPVLIDGPNRVWDSLAIAEYLAEKAPEKNLWPSNPAIRAVARSISCEMHAGFAALRAHLPMVFAEENQSYDPTDQVRRDISRVQEIWSRCRAEFGGEGPFLFGGFSIADAMFAPVVSRFRSYGVDVNETCAAYMQAVWALPSMARWLEDSEDELQSGVTPRSPNSR